MNKIKRHFVLTKIALYKFLSKFIPYFKNKLYMSSIILKNKIEEEINLLLKNEFNGKFKLEDISSSYINPEYENIFINSTSRVGYKHNNYVESAKLCFVMNMKHTNLKIKVSVIYLDNNLEIKFQVPETNTSVFDDCKIFEQIIKDNKNIINDAFRTYIK
ncbi:hypothetical protein [Myroides odoratus]|uniref:hypothetical protein n=1 Tax=Myroides odoratus TaxID=256 RepID=UPI000765FED1|nr:hypothetical protein [Myroides odoratus]